MRTVLMGKKIENVYEVDIKQKQIKDDAGEMKTVYTDKPAVSKTSKVKAWSELCSYEGEPRYNSKTTSSPIIFGLYKTVNISEDEYVAIEDEIFRADLNEMHLRTNKVVEEIDLNKESAESECEEHIRAFNKMMIESNSQLMAYCNLHKLVYEETDCIELFKLVFTDKEYAIKDGVMKVREKPLVYYGACDPLVINADCISNITLGA